VCTSSESAGIKNKPLELMNKRIMRKKYLKILEYLNTKQINLSRLI